MTELQSALVLVDDDGDIRRALRGFECRVRPRVHLIRQKDALGMIGRERIASSHWGYTRGAAPWPTTTSFAASLSHTPKSRGKLASFVWSFSRIPE
jgi:hypothetical protein